ncbi:cold shock domain-containing protein [Pedobacter frigidisoli]|uniref:Cold shock domain-containing protein n=1 Tax=Pedobacter frigidisoli TaxID=2530455 RepID=A0A4R0P2L7_9SPHI|nr:cold shock domain-containing protein [Pedobacter frigidisoli]TCD08313.1 cold shock domain-containing protein [Pedobacter frigidisoli]
MRLGTVKFYDNDQGFGYITPSNGGKEVNVFAHGIIDKIKSNNIVQFDLAFTQTGLEAIKVIVLSS